MTRRSTSDDAARDARDDDDDANFPNEAYARDISLETGESRSGTPPIPPLPPAEYEAMIRAQRAVGRAMRTTGAGTDSDSGIGRLDASAAARVSERTNDGDEDDDADEDADEDDAARRGLGRGGDGAFDGRAVARELMGSYAESDSGVTTTSESARGVRGPSRAAAAKPSDASTRDALERVMVGKPPRGAGRYDSVNADVVEPVKPTTTTNAGSTTGRAKVGWVRVNTQGAVNKLSLEKTKIASLLRVPLRDLRVLEPTTADSYSAAVLCRERAIVVNLEQIKVLITSEEVIMTDSQTSTVTHFLPELRNRLVRRKKIRESKSKPSMTIDLSAVDLSAMGEHATTTAAAAAAAAAATGGAPSSTEPTPPDRSPDKPTTTARGVSPTTEEFPFEFVALEVALEMVCNSLEVEANKVELDAKPALEALRKRVDNVNLERVRKMKTRLVRVTGRVSKVREEIQRYLDDDSDMRDMYLTRKAKQESESYAATLDADASDASSPAPDATGQRTADRSTTTARHRLEHALSVSSVTGRSPLGVHGVHVQGGDAHAAYFDAYDEDKDLQELEDLLETYFTHVDSTHRSLNGLNEYIDDLEDLIEIELDSQRNQLIKLELILTTATLSLTCFSVVVGIFGMNIKNNIENEHDAFLFVAWFGTAGTVGMFLLLLRVCRHYKLF